MGTTVLPNILITGTPGTGKTSLCETLAKTLGFKHINIGSMIKEHELHSGRDESFDTLLFDEASEDKLLDMLEPIMAAGGVIVDFHTVDFFPERFFQLVLVLRTDNTVLFDRLVARGYNPKKVEENVTAEIMQVVLEEARESYSEEIVHEVPSNTPQDAEQTVERMVGWVAAWKADNGYVEPAASSGGSA